MNRTDLFGSKAAEYVCPGEVSHELHEVSISMHSLLLHIGMHCTLVCKVPWENGGVTAGHTHPSVVTAPQELQEV